MSAYRGACCTNTTTNSQGEGVQLLVRLLRARRCRALLLADHVRDRQKVLGWGALGGAWLGLLVVLLLAILAVNPLPAVLTGLTCGVLFGLISAAVPHAMSNGTRDLGSTQQLAAWPLRHPVRPCNADQARAILAHIPGTPPMS